MNSMGFEYLLRNTRFWVVIFLVMYHGVGEKMKITS